MKLTHKEHIDNALDWIGMPGGSLEPSEEVDRKQLQEQMAYTIADDEDIEAIAQIIESESKKRG